MNDEAPYRRVEHWQDTHGHTKDLGEVWTLVKGRREARCVLQGHPVGIEARVIVDGNIQRTEAFKDSKTMINTTSEWRSAFEAKGWTSP